MQIDVLSCFGVVSKALFLQSPSKTFRGTLFYHLDIPLCHTAISL